MLMEIGVDGHRHIVTDAHDGSESIGAKTHVGILTHHLEALSFLLHRIGVVAETVYLQLRSLDLTTLSCTLTLNQYTFCTDTGSRGNILQELLVELCRVNDDLHILNGRTIVQGDKVNCL